VEALSEMMCSLVTNQSGETRYIGMSDALVCCQARADTLLRFLIWFLHLFAQGYSVGE
jgi:hypothetical protein